MGKKHRTLNDTIFRNSKYIEVVNKQVGCDDFKKECQKPNSQYKGQYDFMLETFKTLISLYNCFYSDSNLSFLEKVENAINIMEEYIYKDYEVDKKKYSVRFIQSVSDKYSTYLYRKISNDETGWYVILDDIDSKEINTSPIAKNVIKEIEEEMTKLENIGFDDMVKGSIAYKKNKDSDYKIYISKFDSLNTKQEQFIEEFSTKYNESHITPLNDNELTNIALIYNLVAKVNNGIVKVLSNKPNKNYNLNERSTPSNYYKAYLDSLNISIDDSFFTLNANAFMMNVIITYSNSCGAKGLSLNDMINNFDMYYFLDKIENFVVKKNLSVSDERIQKIILDLKQIYNIITTKNSGLDKLFNNFKRANEIILNIMSRDNNLNYYIRVS